jgi:hypothetical protein
MRLPEGLSSIQGMIVAVAAACLLLLASWWMFARTVPVSQLRPPYQVLIYANGRPVIDRPVAPGSQEERAISGCLQAHPTGWSFSLASYAPWILINGAGFSLNVHTNRCVLNYRASPTDTNFVQVERGRSRETTRSSPSSPGNSEVNTWDRVRRRHRGNVSGEL